MQSVIILPLRSVRLVRHTYTRARRRDNNVNRCRCRDDPGWTRFIRQLFTEKYLKKKKNQSTRFLCVLFLLQRHYCRAWNRTHPENHQTVRTRIRCFFFKIKIAETNASKLNNDKLSWRFPGHVLLKFCFKFHNFYFYYCCFYGAVCPLFSFNSYYAKHRSSADFAR